MWDEKTTGILLHIEAQKESQKVRKALNYPYFLKGFINQEKGASRLIATSTLHSRLTGLRAKVMKTHYSGKLCCADSRKL